jgi:hypothetical protein
MAVCTLTRSAFACPACAAGQSVGGATYALIALLMITPYVAVALTARALRRVAVGERDSP